MTTAEFIQERNSNIKTEWQKVRLDKSKNRDERLKIVAEKFHVSTSTVHDAVYRSKKKATQKTNT